jgi:hypothetical protein
MLKPLDLATFIALDKAGSAAVATAYRAADDAGLLGGQRATLRAAADSRARTYGILRARLTQFLESTNPPSADQLKKLREAYTELADVSANVAASQATSVTGAVVGTVKDTAAQVANPLSWPSWMTWGVGAALAVGLALLLLPRIIVGALFGGRK